MKIRSNLISNKSPGNQSIEEDNNRMGESSSRERDLVLAPNEYAFISDQTKGNINVYVGPYKTSLANTDQPVVFNEETKRFERCHLEAAIQNFAIAPEGWYVVMKNPSKDTHHPKTGTVSSLAELDVGHKVNLPGPCAFALWPGQMVRVVQGHHLRSNQYLLVRVYDEEAAKANWQKAVIKRQSGDDGKSGASGDGPAALPLPDLTMGKLLLIQGTDVSFYIPPTGIEVVRDQSGRYVRDAVTLERLEYCILLDEDGNKRFIRGPAVVFPRPSENFVEKNNSKKFKAIELNEISGLYVKVIAPYSEGGKEYKVGDELFLTGKDQMIYFPRPEHAIIKYGDQEIHYAVAIPAGEGRYVLNRLTGKITLQKGPCMFLADPRAEVIVRRILTPKAVSLWYPGNHEALEYNARLQKLQEGSADFVSDREVQKSLRAKTEAPGAPAPAVPAAEGFAGDDFKRRMQFTQPRTITLENKYEGAVSINAWTGYAVLVVSKTGERKVVVGPTTTLLEYDEFLESVELSTGTPKSDDNLIKTVYLRVLHNKVSDIVEAETRDLCQVQLKVSYRVNFEGPPEKWFDVENYVKFLAEHTRSLLRNAIKHWGIQEFYAQAIDIVRDTVLGKAGEDGKRTGRKFPENGMRIYDVEVLDVKMGNQSIEKLLVQAQHDVVLQTLNITAEKRKLEVTQQSEAIKRQILDIQCESRQKEETVKRELADATAQTKTQELSLQVEEVKETLAVNLAKIESEITGKRRALEARFDEQAVIDKITTAERARQKAASDLELSIAQQKMQQRIEELKADVQAMVDKAGAVSPDLIAALQAFGDKALAERMAQSMAPLAILGGKSVADVLAQLLRGTPIEHLLADKTAKKPEVK